MVTYEDPPIDEIRFGQIVRGARTQAGITSAAAGAELITRAGVPMTRTTLNALERGQVKPSFAIALAVVAAFRPHGALGAFSDALREDLRPLVNDK